MEQADIALISLSSKAGIFRLGRLSTVPAAELRDVGLRFTVVEAAGRTAVLKEVDAAEPQQGSLLLELLQSVRPGSASSVSQARAWNSDHCAPSAIIPQAAVLHRERAGHRICRWGSGRFDIDFFLDIPLPVEFHTEPWRCATCKQHPESRQDDAVYYPVEESYVKRHFKQALVCRVPRQKLVYMSPRFL